MRPKRTRVVDQWAECADVACGWRTDGAGSTGRAALHFDRTGHRTLFHWSVAGEYGTREDKHDPLVAEPEPLTLEAALAALDAGAEEPMS